MSLSQLRTALKKAADPAKAKVCQRFFKTGPGQYGEGDIFYGIVVPELRKMANIFLDLPLKDLATLLKSRIHEERSIALFILVLKYKKADAAEQEKIYQFYIKNKAGINNWDLVDLSAPYIPGPHLWKKKKLKALSPWVKSNNMWDRRIAVLSSFHYIRQNHFQTTLEMAKQLLNDEEDLMHKAVGWMLREIGKKDEPTLVKFLKIHRLKMPRTMLRYAIEKFPEAERKKFLNRHT